MIGRRQTLGLYVSALLAVVCIAVYACSRSLEPPLDVVLSFVTVSQTTYAPRYSDKAFRQVSAGMHRRDVKDLLGEPIEQTWMYEGCAPVRVVGDQAYSFKYDDCAWPSGPKSTSLDALRKVRGEPQLMIWEYSISPNQDSYHRRRVYFRQDQVDKKEASLYID